MSKLPTKIYIAKLCTGSYDDYSETTIGFFYSAKEAAAYANDVNGMIASAIAGIGYHRYYECPKTIHRCRLCDHIDGGGSDRRCDNQECYSRWRKHLDRTVDKGCMRWDRNDLFKCDICDSAEKFDDLEYRGAEIPINSWMHSAPDIDPGREQLIGLEARDLECFMVIKEILLMSEV